ncbi:MFS transporter [Propionimicrobium sp. PCR01-08-3]|uniref:MFS transporter n=1 Tax=Propionimicrobium sp. PCR01-08-3 TaxID=3052086 RepID=UPI00255CB787|nr:MFS transporter [Propionimicrobium sp. PCR01-08-3]WIY82606.1 MFS transporter [Propionimicrobium sp. PCR01-08-3]
MSNDPSQPDDQQPGEDDSVIRVPGTDRVFTRGKMLVVLLSILAMSMMAISAINVALPSIESSLGASNADVQWMLSGYALAFGMVLVAAGRTGDVLGRSSVFLSGVAVFTLASLVCALISDPFWLNAMRVVQGIGAGLSTPQVNGMIVQYFHGHKRAWAFSLFGLVVSASVAVAPLLTGLLIDALGPGTGWRASFLWNVPIGILTIILGFRWLPFGPERERRIAKQQGGFVRSRLDLDPVGMIVLSLTVLAVMLPFMLHRPAGFLLLIAAPVLGWAWIRWERSYEVAGHQPMVNLRLFGIRSFTHATAISFLQFLGATSTFVIIAMHLQSGLGAAALLAGSVGLPNAAASAISSLWAGRHVIEKGRAIVIGAFCCSVTGLLATIVMAQFIDGPDPELHFMWLSIPLVLYGIGVGAINTCNQALSQEDIPANIGGTAGAVKQVGERVGTAVGNAMITAVFFWVQPLSGWTAGFTAALGVIIVLQIIALVSAIFDRRVLGDGRHFHGTA